jgi:hypothetical protein
MGQSTPPSYSSGQKRLEIRKTLRISKFEFRNFPPFALSSSLASPPCSLLRAPCSASQKSDIRGQTSAGNSQSAIRYPKFPDPLPLALCSLPYLLGSMLVAPRSLPLPSDL